MVLIPKIIITRNMNISIFSKKSLKAKTIFSEGQSNADYNDDADAKMPMPRFPSGLDNYTVWWLLPTTELN